MTWSSLFRAKISIDGFAGLVYFLILRHGWIPLAIHLKNKILVFERFVLYFHQLHETLNDLVSTQLLFFQEDFKKSKGSSLFIAGGRDQRILNLSIPPKGSVASKTSPHLQSMLYNFCVLYDYLRLRIALLFMNTKRHLRRQKGSYSALCYITSLIYKM